MAAANRGLWNWAFQHNHVLHGGCGCSALGRVTGIIAFSGRDGIGVTPFAAPVPVDPWRRADGPAGRQTGDGVFRHRRGDHPAAVPNNAVDLGGPRPSDDTGNEAGYATPTIQW